MVKGGATSYRQTKYGILPRSKLLKFEVLGTKRGLLFLNKQAKADRELDPKFVKEVHQISFGEILMGDAGKFRTIQVTYSGKEAPHFSKIPEMIKTLSKDTEFTLLRLPESTEETFIERVVELLANFQHRFVFIHPFVDYNGRTARMFTSYVLMRSNLPIVEIKAEKGKERREYIKALQKADEGDYLGLENIISKALNESLAQVIK